MLKKLYAALVCIFAIQGIQAAGNAAGMDWRLTAISSDEPPAVSGLILAECGGGSLGAGTAAGGAYPIGFDRVGGTTDIVELAFARELITGDVATDWNLFFVAESSLLGAVDVAGPVLVSALGRPLLPDPVPQPAVIPGTTTWGLALLAIAVGLLTGWIARRHPGMLLWVVVIGGSSILAIAWAANYLLDGEIADWDVPAVLSDASGDPTADEPQVDLLAGFAVRAGNQIFFRMDVRETRLPVILQPRRNPAIEVRKRPVTPGHRPELCHFGRYSERLREPGQGGRAERPLPESLSGDNLEALLFPGPGQVTERQIPQPDWAEIDKALGHKSVTRSLLWIEYRQAHPDGYGYSQFCTHYRQWLKQLNPVMRQKHLAGEKLFIDYAGQTVPGTNPETGEIKAAQIFVAVLGASNYTYAEAHATQALPHWLGAHVRALTFDQKIQCRH